MSRAEITVRNFSRPFCLLLICVLATNQAGAQSLPQPALNTPLHAVFNTTQDNSRGIWIDQLGVLDINHPGSRFYNFTDDEPATLPLSLFIDRQPPPDPPVAVQSLITVGPTQIPTMGCLDYDHQYGNFWGGSYDDSGHIWFHYYYPWGPPPTFLTSVWVDAFSGDSLYSDSFVHDVDPRLWDGLAVMPDSTLYIKSDGGFNLFHVDPNLNNELPQKLGDSFLLPFAASGVEVTDNYLLLVSVKEARLYAYSRTGKYPFGFFKIEDGTTPNFRNVEDLDLRVEGSHIYLVGIPLGTATQDVKLLEWDVKPLILDTDNDGVPNVIDNCSIGPHPANPGQLDSNGDGVGDACINDTLNSDGDQWPDNVDNCPYVVNNKQPDADRDGRGDACDDITQCFGTEQLSSLDNGVVDIAIADLDNDGDGEVVTLHNKSYGGPKVGTVAIRWSGSHGTIGNLSEQSAYAVASGQSCRDLVLADVNGDGYTDIAVVHDNTPADSPQPAVPPGVTVLWNDHTNHFGELTHVSLRFEEDGEVLTSGHPVGFFPVYLDGPNDPFPELVVVGNHHFPNSQQQGTVTIVRYYFNNGRQLDAGNPLGLSGGAAIRAIAMPRENGQPERDLAILKTDNTVAIHRCTPGTAPYYDTTGYGAFVVGSNGQVRGRDLAYGLCRQSNFLDLIVIPDDDNNGSRFIDLFINDPVAGTLTLGNGGNSQQLTNNNDGRLWRLIRYPSSPYDGIVVLNDEFPPGTAGGSAGGAQVSRFHATGLGVGTLDVANREDLAGSSEDPNAVMALGDISRSCGRDLVVADYFAADATPLVPSLPRLALARCPFDSASRSFERPAPATPNCAVIADVDGANGADLIVGTSLNELLNPIGRVMVFRQTPGIPNRFGYPPLSPPEGEEYVPQVDGFNVSAQILAMKTGRFGPNNLPDLAIGFLDNDTQQQYVQILNRDTSSEFTLLPEVSIGLSFEVGQIKALATGNFDDDGGEDVIVLTDNQNQTQNANLLLCRGQNSGAQLGSPEAIDAGTLYTGAQLAPVLNAATGRLDLITLLPDNPFANPPTLPSVRILQNIGGGDFGSPTDLEVPAPAGSTTTPTPMAVAIGRVTGVDAPYIACADFANNQIVIYVDFSSGYQLASSIGVSNSLTIHPTSIAATDLESDGDDDLVVGFDDGNTVTVLTCLGRGRFAPMTLPSGVAPRFVTTGDVDGNGLPDVLEIGGFETQSHLRVIFSNCGGM